MPRLLLPALVVVALFPGIASAQGRWKEIGKTSTGNPVYIDPRSVKTGKDKIVTAMTRVVYTKPTPTPKGNITAVRSVAMFDCAKRLVAAKEITIYLDEKTNAQYSHETVAQPGFGPALGSTYAAVALEYFCKK